MKRYLITSALPYINGIKHLGNLVGSLLPADIYARYLRQRGEEVLYICGTDDYGAPAEIAANEEQLPVTEYCQKMHDRQKQIYHDFALSFDYFGKTATASNQLVTQEIFQQLDANDYISEKSIEQYYSITENRFLSDRYIIGTCPKCNYNKARGDQCDGCGSLLDPIDLIEPHSNFNMHAILQLRQTSHLFLDLPKLQNQIQQWTESLKKPSKVVAGIIKKWLAEGLDYRCITRDLDWGIPVPKTNYTDKVFYVWFNAPMGYISLTMDWAQQLGTPELWRSWWLNTDEVHYTQFMAKDNVPFHAVMWPAMLLGSQQNWKLVDNIKGFNWLTYAGGKFSTSQKRGVFTDEALKLFPADYWRYYLIANVPESSDADFSFVTFAQIINNDLADNLGNFIARVLALVEKYFQSMVPNHEFMHIDRELFAQIQTICTTIDHAYSDLKYREIIVNLRSLWALGNEYITKKQPWSMVQQNLAQAGYILSDCLHLIRIFAITLWPIMPTIAEKIGSLVFPGENITKINFVAAMNLVCLPIGSQVAPKTTIFNKIDAELVSELTVQFSGNSF